MYIPLHSGIVVELYRMCRDSDKPLPTNKTDLYTSLVQIILTRYLAKDCRYESDEKDVKKFEDLPGDVYSTFEDITKLAYESVRLQQLIFKDEDKLFKDKDKLFKDEDKLIQHLGLMEVVTEFFPLQRKSTYSCNFLHLSIQEYLGAVYMSRMDTSTQENMLVNMCMQPHLKNMIMFLAAITKFKDMNWERVRRAIQNECEEEDCTRILTKYCLELAFETENIKVLHTDHSCSHALYICTFTVQSFIRLYSSGLLHCLK